MNGQRVYFPGISTNRYQINIGQIFTITRYDILSLKPRTSTISRSSYIFLVLVHLLRYSLSPSWPLKLVSTPTPNIFKAPILSHAMFLKVLKSWVYRTKKKVWCGSKIFIKIELMGPHEWYYVKKSEKNPWHQASTWGFLSWSKFFKINVFSVYFW